MSLSILFAFSSCLKADTQGETTNTTTTIVQNENTTQEQISDTETTTTVKKEKIIGEWICDETISPKDFYAEYYNSKITKANVQLRTTYKFNQNGTFSMSISILNMSTVRTEYRALVVEGGRLKIEKQGKFMTTDDVLHYENYADESLKKICITKKGNYEIDGNKIVYTMNDKNFFETFMLQGDKLMLITSSVSDEGYPVNLVRK